MRITDDTKQIYGRDQDFHFYASNAMEWMTGDDLESIVKKIRKSSKTGRYGELHFWVFYVPLNIKEAEYQINNYVPQVDGIIFLGEYK
jgi:hypothetical protein